MTCSFMCKDINFTEQIKYSYHELFYLLRNRKGEREFYSYCGCLLDRFGFFESTQIHPRPEYNDSSIYKETANRVRQLGSKNILWSGGVDSTYIVCAYVKEKIPFVVYCDDNSVNDNPLFYEWLIKKNYPIVRY